MIVDQAAGGTAPGRIDPREAKPDSSLFALVMITQDDPIYVKEFFEEFLRRYRPLDEIKCVVIAPAMGKRSLRSLVRQMYDFYGAWDFLRIGMRFSRQRLLDRLFPAGLRGRTFSTEGVCRSHGVPVEKWRDVNSPESIARLRVLSPDLVASVAAPQIFKKPFLSVAPLGCLNIHNSRLPRYRGMMPNFWQMLHGEREVGTTIHYINEGIDDGEIVAQRMTPIAHQESLDSLIRRTKRFGAQVMVEAIEDVKVGRAIRLPNPRENSSYFSFPSREDVRRFRQKGYRLL